jgi:hypothetical protein
VIPIHAVPPAASCGALRIGLASVVARLPEFDTDEKHFASDLYVRRQRVA